MGQTRLHCGFSLREDGGLRLEDDTAHYLGNVLRLRCGDHLRVFNANDGEFSARIEKLSGKRAELRLGERLSEPAAPRLEIELCLALSRGDRMAFAIQKSTELGVARITPLHSARSGVRLPRDRVAPRLRHWRRVATSAVEQSGGFRVPEFSEPQALETLLRTAAAPDCARLLFDPSGDARLPEALSGKSLRVVTGPEGGFTDLELELATSHGYAVTALGPRVLRAETAPLAALAILQYRYGDMG